jgi:uncharacterized protein YjbI with pentapeptide repeats
MGEARIGNDKYYLGHNSLGRKAWLLRSKPACSTGASSNLLQVSSDGITPDGALPKPSDELVQRLTSDRDWSGLNLSGLDLRNLKLNFVGVQLDDVSFAGSDIRGLFLRGAKGSRVDFTGAQTQGMIIDCRAALTDVISGGEFDLQGVTVNPTVLRFREPTRLLNASTVRYSIVSSERVLRVANVTFAGDVIKRNDLNAFSLILEGDFTDAVFEGLPDEPYKLTRVGFENCLFRRAVAPNVKAKDCGFQGCSFSEAQLPNWDLEGGIYFGECDFTDADVRGWQDHSPLQEGFRVSELNLHGANLQNTDEKVLRVMSSGGEYDKFTLEEAAEHLHIPVEEVGVLVWLGELEARHNSSFKVDSTPDSKLVHVPGWEIKAFRERSR